MMTDPLIDPLAIQEAQEEAQARRDLVERHVQDKESGHNGPPQTGHAVGPDGTCACGYTYRDGLAEDAWAKREVEEHVEYMAQLAAYKESGVPGWDFVDTGQAHELQPDGTCSCGVTGRDGGTMEQRHEYLEVWLDSDVQNAEHHLREDGTCSCGKTYQETVEGYFSQKDAYNEALTSHHAEQMNSPEHVLMPDGRCSCEQGLPHFEGPPEEPGEFVLDAAQPDPIDPIQTLADHYAADQVLDALANGEPLPVNYAAAPATFLEYEAAEMTDALAPFRAEGIADALADAEGTDPLAKLKADGIANTLTDAQADGSDALAKLKADGLEDALADTQADGTEALADFPVNRVADALADIAPIDPADAVAQPPANQLPGVTAPAVTHGVAAAPTELVYPDPPDLKLALERPPVMPDDGPWAGPEPDPVPTYVEVPDSYIADIPEPEPIELPDSTDMKLPGL